MSFRLLPIRAVRGVNTPTSVFNKTSVRTVTTMEHFRWYSSSHLPHPPEHKQRTLQYPIFQQQQCQTSNRNAMIRSMSSSSSRTKPGTPIKGLDIFKEKDPPVYLERHEYPEWIYQLAQPLASLAKLRRLDEGEATDFDKKRYLKLTRRMKIKATNETKKVK
jgi:Mitochondrial ribosomal protein L37